MEFPDPHCPRGATPRVGGHESTTAGADGAFARHCKRDFPEWDQAFTGNRLLRSATLDRLRHNAYCRVLDGAFCRTPRTLPGAAKLAPAKPATQAPSSTPSRALFRHQELAP